MLIPKNVTNIAKVAYDGADRPVLNSVFLRRGEKTCCAYATDGRALVRAEWAEDPTEEYPTMGGVDPSPIDGFSAVVPAPQFGALGKIVPKRAPHAILCNLALSETAPNGLLHFSASDLDTTRNEDLRAVEGTYPNCETPLSMGTPQISLTLDPYLLLSTLETVIEVSGARKVSAKNDKIDPITLNIYAADKPIQITAKVADHSLTVTGLQMPMVK